MALHFHPKVSLICAFFPPFSQSYQPHVNRLQALPQLLVHSGPIWECQNAFWQGQMDAMPTHHYWTLLRHSVLLPSSETC